MWLVRKGHGDNNGPLLHTVVVLTKDFLLSTDKNRRKRKEREREWRREKAEKRYRRIDGRIT